jgi:hypothetical protein
MAEKSLSALNWPMSPCNVTTRLDGKALRAFPFFVFQIAEMRKIAFGQFNGPDLV